MDERRHGDRRAAQIAWIMWNAWAKEPKPFGDFMLTPEKTKKKLQTNAQKLFVVEMLNAALGGEDLREKVK